MKLFKKDCCSFVPLVDGTFQGSMEFCDLSFKCRQVGMIAKKIKMVMPNGEIMYELLCTGMRVVNEEDKDLNR